MTFHLSGFLLELPGSNIGNPQVGLPQSRGGVLGVEFKLRLAGFRGGQKGEWKREVTNVEVASPLKGNTGGGVENRFSYPNPTYNEKSARVLKV